MPGGDGSSGAISSAISRLRKLRKTGSAMIWSVVR
jgi:hypothetical protein